MAPSSFGRSEFDAFLFASVGADKSGVEVTVLSVLIRLGFDPWQEAARLSELPRETAAQTLASTFSRLPEHDWQIPQLAAVLPVWSTAFPVAVPWPPPWPSASSVQEQLPGGPRVGCSGWRSPSDGTS